MTKKNRTTAPTNPKPSRRDPRTIRVYATSEDDGAAATARAITAPTAQAALSIYDVGKDLPTTVTDLSNELQAQATQIHSGDMNRAESMLIAQAHTLDALFNSLTRSALASKLLTQYEVMFRLALRSQAQCRTTLETLSAIKNPPVIFAKQANITSGPQQINNDVCTRGGENGNEPNKQLQHTPRERLDFGAQRTTGSISPNVEAVGAIHRP